MNSNPEKLECVSIILCDDVYRDEATKKLVIIGTFNRIYASDFPALHQQMVVLFSLTNAKGSYELWLRISNEATGQDICRIGGPFVQENPLAMVDVNVKLRGVQFPEPGKYWVVLESDREVLRQRPFVVERFGDAGEGGGSDEPHGT